MDLQRLNELLSPYKIEIVCDNCQKTTERSVHRVSDFPEPPTRPEVLHTDKKHTPKGNKSRGYSHSKSAKTRGETHRHIDSTQKPRRPEFPEPTGLFAVTTKNVFVPRQSMLPHPPNSLLNLKSGGGEPVRRLTIQDFLESNRNTPHKIDNEDLERYCHSEDRPGGLRLNYFNNNTAQPGLFCPDESPIPTHIRHTQGRPQTPSDDRLALGFGPSREASPFRPIDQRLCNTPSRSEQTPQKWVQFTPNLRNVDGAEDNVQESFNLLQYPHDRPL